MDEQITRIISIGTLNESVILRFLAVKEWSHYFFLIFTYFYSLLVEFKLYPPFSLKKKLIN